MARIKDGFCKVTRIIDDVRIYNRALSPEEIEDIYREGQSKAFNASPEDGATGVDPNVILSWSPGKDAVSHDVYLGTNFDDVNDANTSSPEFMGNFDVNSFDPCGLDFDGVDDYVQVPDDDSLTPSDEITIAFWVYNRTDKGTGIYKYASCPGEPDSPGSCNPSLNKFIAHSQFIFSAQSASGIRSPASHIRRAATINQRLITPGPKNHKKFVVDSYGNCNTVGLRLFGKILRRLNGSGTERLGKTSERRKPITGCQGKARQMQEKRNPAGKPDKDPNQQSRSEKGGSSADQSPVRPP